MLKHIYFLGIILASSSVFAGPFLTFEGDFSFKKNSESLLTNLPPVLSQDSLGLCYSHSATVALNYENCRAKNQDCTILPDTDAFSALDVARFGQNDKDGVSSEQMGIKDGGYSGLALYNVAVWSGSAASESCFSLDKVLSKFGGTKGLGNETELMAFKRLKEQYDKFQKLKECESCVTSFFAGIDKTVGKDFELPKDNSKMLDAFSAETYEKFFEKLFKPAICNRLSRSAVFERQQEVTTGTFPKDKPTNYAAMTKQIKKLLDVGYMPILNDICKDEDKAGPKCPETHSVAITGMATLCDSSGNCHDALRVQNSYGQDWQNDNRDGWVSAQRLLDSTAYGLETLDWIEEKNKDKEKERAKAMLEKKKDRLNEAMARFRKKPQL